MKFLEDGVFKSVEKNEFEILYKGLPLKIGLKHSDFFSWFLNNW